MMIVGFFASAPVVGAVVLGGPGQGAAAVIGLINALTSGPSATALEEACWSREDSDTVIVKAESVKQTPRGVVK